MALICCPLWSCTTLSTLSSISSPSCRTSTGTPCSSHILWSTAVEVITSTAVGSATVNGPPTKLLRMCIRRERERGGYIKIDLVIEIKLYNKISCTFASLQLNVWKIYHICVCTSICSSTAQMCPQSSVGPFYGQHWRHGQPACGDSLAVSSGIALKGTPDPPGDAQCKVGLPTILSTCYYPKCRHRVCCLAIEQ